jgi:hypothetical protein
MRGNPKIWEEQKLLFNRSADRASICARAAGNALVGVDNELSVAFGNATNRTSVCACAASDALIGNLVCHK